MDSFSKCLHLVAVAFDEMETAFELFGRELVALVQDVDELVQDGERRVRIL